MALKTESAARFDRITTPEILNFTKKLMKKLYRSASRLTGMIVDMKLTISLSRMLTFCLYIFDVSLRRLKENGPYYVKSCLENRPGQRQGQEVAFIFLALKSGLSFSNFGIWGGKEKHIFPCRSTTCRQTHNVDVGS